MNFVSTSFSSQLFPEAAALSDLASTHGPDFGHAPRLLFDGLEEAAILLQDELITYANPAAGSLLNAEPPNLEGKPLNFFLSESEHGELYRYLRSHEPEESSMKQRGEIVGDSGLSTPVDIQCLPVRGAQGKHMLFIRSVSDPLPEAGDHTCLSLADLQCGAMRLDRDLRYLYGNHALTEMATFFALAQPGKHVKELAWPPSLSENLEQIMLRLSQAPLTQHFPFMIASGQTMLEWWATVIPHRSRNGQLAAATFLFDSEPADVTRPSHDAAIEQQLQHERKKCEEAVVASRARDAFFGWVSHELRTPMNGIQSWAHILETYVNASSSSPLAQRALRGIRNGISQQLQLVDELLEVSRIIEGKLSLSKQAFVLRPVLQAAMEDVETAALAGQVHLTCDYALSREKLSGDPCRVQQMLRLLLSYLIDESRTGSTVHLHVECRNKQAVIRLHGTEPQLAGERRSAAGNVSRMAKPARVCRKEVDTFLVKRLAEMQGGRLDYSYEAGSPLPAITLVLPLHVPGKRRSAPD